MFEINYDLILVTEKCNIINNIGVFKSIVLLNIIFKRHLFIFYSRRYSSFTTTKNSLWYVLRCLYKPLYEVKYLFFVGTLGAV
jgi:hypothetical protein